MAVSSPLISRRLLALVLATASFAVVSTAPAPAADEPLQGAQRLLDARVAALKSGDKGAYMATVDPKAPSAFRQGQDRQFDGLRKLPLAKYELEARLQDSGDLSRGLSAKYGGARVFLPETRQRLRLQDYDDRDAVDSLWLTFIERDGRWYVAGDTDLDDLGLLTSKGLWDFGPIDIKRTDHFLVMFHPAQAARAAVLADVGEESIGNVNAGWHQPWSGRIPMVLPGSVDELEKVIQSTVDLDKFVAFVAYGADRDTAYEDTAPRMYIQDKNLGRYERPFQVQTLTHELNHAAVAPLAGPLMPAWVHEGTAEWVAKDRSTSTGRPRGSDGRLPRDFEFATGSGTSIVAAYREAESAISFLAARSGPAGVEAFMRSMGEQRVAPGNPDHNVDAALRKVLGLGTDQFEQAWRKR